MKWLKEILVYLRTFAAKMDAWEDAFIKKYLDINTYSSAFRNLIFLSAGWYVMWHPDVIYLCVQKFGASGRPLTSGEITWYRLWAKIIFGTGITVTLFSIIMITLRRIQSPKNPEQTTSETDVIETSVSNSKASIDFEKGEKK